MTHLTEGASGFDWGSLPLHADALTAAPWAPPAQASDFVLGTPEDGREPRYPGRRPPGSFVVFGGSVLTVRPATTGCGWQVLPDDTGRVPLDLDDWLADNGQLRIGERSASVGYGSNLNPGQVADFAGTTAVVVLRAMTVGLASAYCTSRRNDGQYPAGIVAAEPARVEVHGVVLIDPSRAWRLDGKEGQGGVYNRTCLSGVSAPVGAVLEDGTMVTGSLPAYVQGTRAIAMHDGRPVLLADVEQKAYAAAKPAEKTHEHGLRAAGIDALPALRTGPVPVFVYGTLRPGHGRWPGIESLVERHEPASIHGDRFDTGYGYPGLRLGRPDAPAVDGSLLHPRVDRHAALLGALDRIEGHPDLYARHLVRIDDGRLAWTYVWNA